MKRTVITLTVVASTAAAFGVSGLFQPATSDAESVKKQFVEMMRSKGQPTEAHKLLEQAVGEFDSEFRMFVPGMPPLVAKGTMAGRSVLGGRFVEVTSHAAEDEVMKIESISYFGFDGRKGKYYWWGIDSTDTYSVFAEGDYDPATKSISMYGENEEPGLGKVPFKAVLSVGDPARSTMEIWFQMQGAPGADADGWFRMVEIVKTRR